MVFLSFSWRDDKFPSLHWQLSNKLNKTKIPTEGKLIMWWTQKAFRHWDTGKSRSSASKMRECKTRVVWNGLRGAFAQICWGFTTQVNITCSLPSHNSSPMAPRARQQATVSQEAQTGPTLHNWGRYAAERRKKKRRNIPRKCAEGEKPALVSCLNCLRLCVIRPGRCADWKKKQDSSTEAENSRCSPLRSGRDGTWQVGMFCRTVCTHKQVDLVTVMCALDKPVPIAIKEWALWILCFLLSATRCFQPPLASRRWRRRYSHSQPRKRRLMTLKWKKKKSLPLFISS